MVMNDTNVIEFIPKKSLEPKENLASFISFCEQKLSIYDDQGGFAADSWIIQKGKAKRRLNFTQYIGNTRVHGPLMQRPFLDFAKAYLRYQQSIKETVTATDELQVLRLLHECILANNRNPCILNVDGIVVDNVVHLIKQNYGEGSAYHLGVYLEKILNFIREINITPRLPEWKNTISRPSPKAQKTDEESVAWQSKRCLSLHQVTAVADIFASAQEPVDLYWSSVMVLLMFSPSRAGELSDLSVNSLIEDEGRLWVQWYGEKGYGHTTKPVPRELESTVKLAFQRLIAIGKPAREAAKFAHTHPKKFLRHPKCVTPDNINEDTPLNAYEFARAFCIGHSKIDRIVRMEDKNSQPAWTCVNTGNNWIKKLLESGPITYEKCAEYVANLYQNRTWPRTSEHGPLIWESLLLIRDYEFHEDFEPKEFSWKMPSINDLNLRLGSSKYPGKRKASLFNRFNMSDEDGGDIQITSHQFRVWLSTVCERAGMDSWMLAKFAGRARIDDNKHYDLRTQDEKYDQAISVLDLELRPKPLSALKLNLPVAYEDLGENRIGVAQITQYGFCLHDFASSPCTKNAECMTCKEHACVKGMPNTLERILLLERQVSDQLDKAVSAEESQIFGADRWVTYLGWRLSHIRSILKIFQSDKYQDGTIVRIPLEHDPSPIIRALSQKTETKPKKLN